MIRRDSFVARSLTPLVETLWVLFLVWSGVVALLWLGGWSADEIRAAIANPGLREALRAIAGAADAVWLALAAANLYVIFGEREGVAGARRWVLLILLVAFALAACSVRTSYPLGAVYYTTYLGEKVARVPIGWPLLWVVVVLSGRDLAARLLPRASHRALALATGALALLTDFNLEPLATKERFHWFWSVPGTHLHSPPLWRNYATWFAAAGALAFVLRERDVMTATRRPPLRSALVLVLMNALFLLTHLRRALLG